jgi:hypothetical protein
MITIGHDRFEVPVPFGMATFAFQQQIIPVAGKLIGAVMGLTGGHSLGSLLDADVLADALPQLSRVFSDMKPGELEAITRTLLKDAVWLKAGGPKAGLKLFGEAGGDVFDTAFRGRTLDGWKLLWHAVQVWYPDFFALLGGLRAQPGAKAAPSEASTTSTDSPAGA